MLAGTGFRATDRVVYGAAAIDDRRCPSCNASATMAETAPPTQFDTLADLEHVIVAGFSTLVVEYARQWGAVGLVRGLRAISDYEWEFQMGHLNKRLAPEIETVYLMSSPQYSFLSSSGVKEIAAFGGALDELVPSAVARAFAERTAS